MSLIVNPSDSGGGTNFLNITQWVDAFTAVQECTADARSDTRMRGQVAESVKQLRAHAKETGDAGDKRVLANQLAIQGQLESFKPEMHRELMTIWRRVAKEIIAESWDLTKDVGYQEEYKGGPLRFWQSDKPGDAPKGRVFPRLDSLLIIKFLKFVAAQSDRDDPVTYTKKMLLSQGINAENFHLYADKLAFPNPWTAT